VEETSVKPLSQPIEVVAVVKMDGRGFGYEKYHRET